MLDHGLHADRRRSPRAACCAIRGRCPAVIHYAPGASGTYAGSSPPDDNPALCSAVRRAHGRRPGGPGRPHEQQRHPHPRRQDVRQRGQLLQRHGLLRQRRSHGRPEQVLPHGRHHPALRHVPGLRPRLLSDRDLQVPRQPEVAPRPRLRHLARRARRNGRGSGGTLHRADVRRGRQTRPIPESFRSRPRTRPRSLPTLRRPSARSWRRSTKPPQDFASATISSVQAGNGQMAFLATFNASKSRSIWNGALRGYRLLPNGAINPAPVAPDTHAQNDDGTDCVSTVKDHIRHRRTT